eukprot:TRINITY_DN28204_c0_g1_i1.p2 TRINITY_DN28204_c0_g1~~TRINITY_DN28204_c0_g1_i1.p2  ORF type:complete len:112 (+),score=26.17 TRINITY_DN28204_c0_g1_i1:155-490(+)
MIRRPPRSTLSSSSAASDVYKRQERRPPNLVPPREGDREAGVSRKAEQDTAMARKVAMRTVHPSDMFRGQPYSRFDEDGIPTHGLDGELISKNGRKKLKKQWLKHKLVYES